MSNLNTAFTSFLKEDTISALPSPGNGEIGLSSEEEIRTLEAINSVLAGLTTAPAMNPYYMVERIKDRVKLATGLTFDDVLFVGDLGQTEKVLIPADHFSAHTHSGLTVTDNGFLNKFPGGLVISFQFLKSGGIYHVNAEIKKAPAPTPGKITEKKEK